MTLIYVTTSIYWYSRLSLYWDVCKYDTLACKYIYCNCRQIIISNANHNFKLNKNQFFRIRRDKSFFMLWIIDLQVHTYYIFFLLGMAYNAGKKFENSQKMKFVFIKWIPCGYESRLKDYRRFSNVARALVIVCCSLCVTFFGLTTFWCYLQSYHWTNTWQHVHESSLLIRWRVASPIIIALIFININFFINQRRTHQKFICAHGLSDTASPLENVIPAIKCLPS